MLRTLDLRGTASGSRATLSLLPYVAERTGEVQISGNSNLSREDLLNVRAAMPQTGSRQQQQQQQQRKHVQQDLQQQQQQQLLHDFIQCVHSVLAHTDNLRCWNPRLGMALATAMWTPSDRHALLRGQAPCTDRLLIDGISVVQWDAAHGCH